MESKVRFTAALSAEALGTALLSATKCRLRHLAETLTKDAGACSCSQHASDGAILVVLITISRPGFRVRYCIPRFPWSLALKRRPDRARATRCRYMAVQVAGGLVRNHQWRHGDVRAGPLLEAFAQGAEPAARNWLAEGVAAFGLVRNHSRWHPLPERCYVPVPVGLYIQVRLRIGSHPRPSFANPAVATTLRSMTQ